MTDLVCLVADKNIEAAVSGLLEHRRHALGIRPVRWRIHVHPRRDPGCYHDGPAMLAELLAGGGPSARSSHGLLVFDHAWEGNPHATANDVTEAIQRRFRRIGIADRSQAIVIAPEVEAWVWSGSPHVERVLGWTGTSPSLRAWLCDQGLWPPDAPKPPDPKEAMERVLRRQRLPRSSALYRDLARKVSLRGCHDPAFQCLVRTLRRWFPTRGARLD